MGGGKQRNLCMPKLKYRSHLCCLVLDEYSSNGQGLEGDMENYYVCSDLFMWEHDIFFPHLSTEQVCFIWNISLSVYCLYLI